MTAPARRPRLAFNLLQLYSLEAWGSDDAPDELPLEECLREFVAAVIEWDHAEGDQELDGFEWRAI